MFQERFLTLNGDSVLSKNCNCNFSLLLSRLMTVILQQDARYRNTPSLSLNNVSRLALACRSCYGIVEANEPVGEADT